MKKKEEDEEEEGVCACVCWEGVILFNVVTWCVVQRVTYIEIESTWSRLHLVYGQCSCAILRYFSLNFVTLALCTC